MSIDLSIFNDILFRHLSPWKSQDSEHKYGQLLNGLQTETYKYQPLFKVVFQKPVSQKRQYYYALILNQAISFLNSINSNLESALNEQEKKYWVLSALDRQLKPKFDEVRKLIEKRSYQVSNITLVNDDAYIIQFLKYQLIRLYLEIQNAYTVYITGVALEQGDIHLNFFTDASIENSIAAADKLELPQRQLSPIPNPPPAKIEALNYDIRGSLSGVLTYEQIIKKPEVLGRIEVMLVEDGYLDNNFKFVKRDGNKVAIAAIARMLYNKKIFKEITFVQDKKIPVTKKHIQKFFSHRYMTSIDQEFRRFDNIQTLQTFLDEKASWIKLLPYS